MNENIVLDASIRKFGTSNLENKKGLISKSQKRNSEVPVSPTGPTVQSHKKVRFNGSFWFAGNCILLKELNLIIFIIHL